MSDTKPPARKMYAAPKTWADMMQLRQTMMVDILKRAQIGATNAGFAAEKLGMTRNNYVISCRRLGIEVEHLLDREHPRHPHLRKDKLAA